MRLVLRLDARLAPTPEGETPRVEPLPVPCVVQVEVDRAEWDAVAQGDTVTVVLQGRVQAKF